MISGRSRLNFEVGPGAGVKTVKHVVPIEIFLAAGIVDGEGKVSNRVVFRSAGDERFYFMFLKGTEEAMKPAAGWLQEQLEGRVGRSGAECEAIPEDPVTDLPTDPMEV